MFVGYYCTVQLLEVYNWCRGVGVGIGIGIGIGNRCRYRYRYYSLGRYIVE